MGADELSLYLQVHGKMITGAPKITVIVSVLNRAQTLERCLESVVSQKLAEKELIMIDGGSTDGSLSVIRSYNDNISFWESGPDRGVYHAWNKALNHVRGEWICFLGADDYFWDNDVLSTIEPHLKKAVDSGIKIVYGEAAKINRKGRVIKTVGKPWKKIQWLMRHGMPFIHAGVMHHHSLFKDHGLFDESFIIAGDYEFLLRELISGPALFALGIRTVGHGTGGLSDSNKIENLRETAKARRMHGLPSFSLIWTAIYIREFLRSHKFMGIFRRQIHSKKEYWR